MPNLCTPKKKRARGRGRPSKCTLEVRVTIAIALRRGATLTAACREAGISIKTACEWLARARGEDPQRPSTPRYTEFAASVARAQALFTQARVRAYLQARGRDAGIPGRA